MMNIEVERFGFGLDSTLGALYVDGEFLCFTLEDERRVRKVRDETCIPLGHYEVKLRDEGGVHERYKDRFPELHKGMLWLQDVPDFEWIYFHTGSKETHTSGCILVANVPVALPNGEFEIAQSQPAYLQLYRQAISALAQGERVFVHIREREPR